MCSLRCPWRPRRALEKEFETSSSAGRPSLHELRDLSDHLRHGACGGHVIQRYVNVESILELRDNFEHLQRVEAEVGNEIAVERRLDRPAANAFEDVEHAF